MAGVSGVLTGETETRSKNNILVFSGSPVLKASQTGNAMERSARPIMAGMRGVLTGARETRSKNTISCSLILLF